MPVLGWASDAPHFTAEEKAWIAAHPIVRTRVDQNWRPFEFRERGRIVGVVPSYLDAISRISGLRFEYVDGMSWSGSYDALMSGKIDMVPDVSKTSDVSKYRDGTILSHPYFVGTMLVVASERLNQFVDFRNLAGRRIAIKGNGELEYAIRNSGLPVTLMTYDDERDALAAVADGKADVAVGPDMSILPLLRRQFEGELFVSGGLPDRPYALAMATRGDMPLLASILDKSLAAIPARSSEDIPRQWIESADYGKPTLRSILYYHRWQATAAGAILLALAAIAFVSWRARVTAIRSERDKAMFLAFISHEIRTPMHTILSSLELLQRSKLAPKQASRADAAIAASESLLTLLDDVLEYSRLESRNVTLAPEPTHIGPWAQRSADMVRWRVDEKGLGFAVELACPTGLCVLIDPLRTRQIVLNLLVNAIKFTSAGSIALRVDYLDDKPGRAGSLVIEIRDTGIGIPPERQRRIFEPYQRVEQSGSRRVGGSGLGLSICRELVDLMKGNITVSSNPDKGTVFTVILPARRTARASTPATTGQQAPVSEPLPPVQVQQPGAADAARRIADGPSILVVDDHEAVQHAIQHQLDALTCRSVIAGTGEHALEQFERAPFDMVLLDCNLPDIDGYTVARHMRDSERLRKQARTPIIAISAATDDAHRERCFESGMDGVLGKPLRLEVLRQMIDLWCSIDDASSTSSQAQDTQPATPDFRAIYRQSVDADLAALDDALSNGDANRARHAAHRVKGVAAIAGHTATSELAAELERRLQAVSDGIPNGIDALHGELMRLHRADAAGPGASKREPGDASA
ncbi:response regulator [Burkholderia ambifaria]|uniref:ATP-binding protein n=1 Tax=Burkholderia ambifaria TaxID=152480 RepID=UPI001E414D54|nr:ATP-binding protein [Burkholderia ambifaria]UEP49799.1 response regulator [Burkholderia ambifaria]